MYESESEEKLGSSVSMNISALAVVASRCVRVFCVCVCECVCVCVCVAGIAQKNTK